MSQVKPKAKPLDINQFKNVIVLAVAVAYTSAVIASVTVNAMLVGSFTKEVVVNVYMVSSGTAVISYIIIHLTLGWLNKGWAKRAES